MNANVRNRNSNHDKLSINTFQGAVKTAANLEEPLIASKRDCGSDGQSVYDSTDLDLHEKDSKDCFKDVRRLV